MMEITTQESSQELGLSYDSVYEIIPQMWFWKLLAEDVGR